MVHAHTDVSMLCVFIHVDRWVLFQLLLIRGIYQRHVFQLLFQLLSGNRS
jgi:hypothetical protein